MKVRKQRLGQGRAERLRAFGRTGCVVAVLLGLALAVTGVSRARLTAPRPTSLVRARGGHFLVAVGDGPRGYWPLGNVPERVAAATIAIEDRRFARHPGVDPIAIGRALLQNLAAGRRVSGASTIAMQIARMQQPGPRTWVRKIVEAVTAVCLTARYGREAILEHYLRIVPYGNRIHGIAFAARVYLDKPVEDLSWAEIAFLAAIPQSPARMNPYAPSGRARAVVRGRRILDALLRTGVMGEDEHALATHELARLQVRERGRRPWSAMHLALRLDRMLREPAGATPGPLLVTSTIDLDLQERVLEMARRSLARWRDAGAGNTAVLVVDLDGCRVRAAVGSAGYFDASARGAIDYTRVPRFVGSTLKPFLYGLALDRRVITPTTILDDIEPGPGDVEDADHRFLGPLLPRFALANSRNVPAVNLLNRVGLEEVYTFFETLGLHDHARPARYYGQGIAIGAIPISLEQLVRAWTALATGGVLYDLVWYEGQPTSAPRRVLSEASARLVTLFLSDPSARLPVFPRMGATEYPFPVAVKTGTSAGYRDAWTVAYSNRYLVGVWVGDPDYQPMRRLGGFGSAAVLARDVLDLLHEADRGGLSDLSFPAPRGFVSRRICPLSGALATSVCDPVVAEWMAPEDVPATSCPMHVRIAVDRRSGRVATGETPRQYVELHTFVNLPPRYAGWALAAGLPVMGLEPGPPRQAAAPAPSSTASIVAATASPGPTNHLDPGRNLLHTLRWNSGAGVPVRVTITFPRNGSRLLRDPESPGGMDTLALRAAVSEPVAQLLWYVDGTPFRTVAYPYTVRWPVSRGEHVFVAEVPFTHTRSSPVRVVLE